LAGFEGGGRIIAPSYAAAYYHGRSAGYFSGSRQCNPVKAFPTVDAAKAFYQTSSTSTAVRPSLVPYLALQLDLLDLLEDTDSGCTPANCVHISGYDVGHDTPMLVESHDQTCRVPWRPFLPPEPPEIVPSLAPLPFPTSALSPSPDTVTPSMASTAESSMSTASTAWEERRSRDRKSVKKIPALPTDGDALRQWVENLSWHLPGSSWCHDGTHVTELTATEPLTESLSLDFCSVIMSAAMQHTGPSERRPVYHARRARASQI
jgi:hypothetical protein